MVWARPELAGWAAVAAILFAAFNVLLTWMVFAWLIAGWRRGRRGKCWAWSSCS